MLREKGTVLESPTGLVLVKDSGATLKLCGDDDLSNRAGEYVLIDGELTPDGHLQVVSVGQMMTDEELGQCAHFLYERHGPAATDHANHRLDLAQKEGSAADVEIWREIVERVKEIRFTKRTPWNMPRT